MIMAKENSMEAVEARIKAIENATFVNELTKKKNNSVSNPTTENEVLHAMANQSTSSQNNIFDELNKTQKDPYDGLRSMAQPPKPPMIINIKRTNPDAVLPKYGHIGEDACFDLTAIDVSVDEYGNSVYDFGWAFEIPQGYVGLVFPRSSNSKKDMLLTNCVGVIDSGYRGSITAKFRPLQPSVSSTMSQQLYKVGERVCQMMIIPIPQIEFNVVEELSESSRGKGGYGSTGK